MQVVVSQSMYFPWVGLLEQIRLADVFVHYDDVQFTRGFYNRVQIKTPQGPRWLTVPLRNQRRGQTIDEVLVDDRVDWRSQHRDILRQAYVKAPFRGDMLELVDKVLSSPSGTLAGIARNSIIHLAGYFRILEHCHLTDSKSLRIGGGSSQRLHDIVLNLGGSVYITGLGALNYLDHNLFERSAIKIRYMQYQRLVYPQLHGDFTPYVSALDLVANCGREGRNYISSIAVDKRDLFNEPS